MRTRPNITRAAALMLIVSAFFAVLVAPAASAQGDDMVISPTTVGPAEIGSTVDELTEQLGSDYTVGDEVRITVDFSGHVVSRDGEVQFRAVKANAPGDELSLFIINNDEFATAAGVGPGMTIADAEAIYGEATLNWNPDNEGREFVSFENQPEGRIQFRTPGIAGTNVGVYGDGELETNEYDPEGVIAAVWISCVPGTDCPADSSGADTATAGGDADDGDADDGDADDDDADDGDADGGDADDGDDEEEAPAPTPTPTPTPEPEPEDDDEDDADAASSGSGSGGQDELPATGFEEILLVSLASTLFLAGGIMVLLHRNYLAPMWLRSRRW